jgi:cytochrome c-type biogenesis protein CcmH
VAQAGASVQARISLAPALAAKAAPEDTVFIFARALQGSKAPLAILRRQVKDLPLEVTLDDSTAMSPALRLSTQTQVVQCLSRVTCKVCRPQWRSARAACNW